MNEGEYVYDKTILNNIMNSIVDNTTRNGPHLSTFPEHQHPRRKIMYKRWECDSNTFFTLRSRGVPLLTAYFLCEISNNVRTHRSISNFVTSQNKYEALNTLKIM